jgi:hypothetical protein
MIVVVVAVAINRMQCDINRIVEMISESTIFHPKKRVGKKIHR